MWPNRAFHDQNLLPHSVHGGVILGAAGSGFLAGFCGGAAIRNNLVRFFLGLRATAVGGWEKQLWRSFMFAKKGDESGRGWVI